MKKWFKIFLLLLSITHIASAQDKAEMAEVFYSEGKIYVVLGVIAIIFIGIAVYLFSLDKKISGLEKEIKK